MVLSSESGATALAALVLALAWLVVFAVELFIRWDFYHLFEVEFAILSLISKSYPVFATVDDRHATTVVPRQFAWFFLLDRTHAPNFGRTSYKKFLTSSMII